MHTSVSTPSAHPLALPAGAWALPGALLALLAWDVSKADLWAMRQVGDAAGFALRDSWYTASLIHQGGRLLSWGVMVFILLVNLLPRRLLPRLSRHERVQWLAVTVTCLLAVSLIKRASLTSCPWDLAEFGGTAHYVSHWALGRHDGGGGHCFPSGHASAAFAFLCGGWVLARAYPRLGRAWLITVIALGGVYGLGQMLRGAHYPSHTMWTAWICWALTAGLMAIRPRVVARAGLR